MEHRVVIDTQGATRSDDWQARITMPLVSELDAQLAAYIERAIASPDLPPTNADGRHIAHARLAHHDWLLVVTSASAGE